ncbi:hypothetical protein [Lacticaseibacillus parakribbianus]|uniref:hypothetical protein n=1 Tax=Lacticaseibacillus parakribbianus TaxID=2970927 RepID=UPI0021CB4612|nr:hypothetical protein [Lacticaseibacillus parakribbianus]
METFQVAFGKYLNDYRKARRIPLGTLAQGRGTTLSRFFNHGNNISLQMITDTMRRMGLTYADLTSNFPRFDAAFTSAVNTLIANRYAADERLIREIATGYLQDTAAADGPIAVLNRQVMQHVLQVSVSRRPALLPDGIQATIEQVLMSNADWLVYDYLLLRLGMVYLDDARLGRCYQMLRERMATMRPGYQHYANDAMLQFGIVCLARRTPMLVPTYPTDLAQIQVSGYSFQDALVINAIRRLFRNSVRLKTGPGELEAVFEVTATLHLTQIEGYLRRLLAVASGEAEGVFV